MTNNTPTNETTARLIRAAASLRTANWDPTKGRSTRRSSKTKHNNR